MPNVRDHIQRLKHHYKPDDEIATAIWGVDDVLLVAEQQSIKLDRKEAAVILEEVHQNHHATTGINWDVLNAHVDIFCSARRIRRERRRSR